MVGMSRQARKSLGKQGNQSASMEISRQARKYCGKDSAGGIQFNFILRLLLCVGLELEVREGGRHPFWVYVAVLHPRLGFEPAWDSSPARLPWGVGRELIHSMAVWPSAW